jgi:hypothetical protein
MASLKSLIDSANKGPKSQRQQRLDWEEKINHPSTRAIYLVQRICAKKPSVGQSKGVDQYFSFDYMGSAEFEYGALPSALREMRALHTDKALTFKEIKVGDTSFGWFVGPDEKFDMAAMLVEDQHNDRPALRHKEDPRMKDSNYIGWFAIDASFVIFRDKQDAGLWLGLMAPLDPIPLPFGTLR